MTPEVIQRLKEVANQRHTKLFPKTQEEMERAWLQVKMVDHSKEVLRNPECYRPVEVCLAKSVLETQ